jgi:hypothetical protein
MGIFVFLRNRTRQRLNFIIKPLNNFDNSTILPWIRQTSHTNFIHGFLQVHLKLTKLLAVMNTIVLKLFAHSGNIRLTSSHSFGFFSPECIDTTVKARILLFQLPMIHGQRILGNFSFCKRQAVCSSSASSLALVASSFATRDPCATFVAFLFTWAFVKERACTT